ncbi:hypothetical protein [Aquabacterium sp. J223]|uniref:DUF7674 family protein n=1 Tax=Aquabacterium sp. J223 TaxID=2898431 RepID=UPI0021ADDCA4|nr:hypothetical protein [Aquabacterium sp. J223]UUX95559.1 hypothetical protein LRS07_20535 [Aquabacterium sp. J223]
MIQQAEVMPLLLEACPGFAEAWVEHVRENGNDLLYVAAGSFARYLLSLHQSGQLSELSAAGAAIEQLHVSGSQWVKEFATIGLLEGIQNVWSHSNTDPECFRQFLGPESQRWWAGLNKFWSGQAPHAQVDG